jgi:hypothetical protein
MLRKGTFPSHRFNFISFGYGMRSWKNMNGVDVYDRLAQEIFQEARG